MQKKEVCYAVGVGVVELKIKGSGLSSRDYFLICANKDASKVKELGFHFCNDKKIEALERSMSTQEIIDFKAISDKFTKVKHDAEGRVYELKNNSFKEYFLTL